MGKVKAYKYKNWTEAMADLANARCIVSECRMCNGAVDKGYVCHNCGWDNSIKHTRKEYEDYKKNIEWEEFDNIFVIEG